MGKVILDAELRKKFNDGREVVEVYDESGQVVGHYLPHDEYARMVYAMEWAETTPEELEAARRDIRENGGVTTADILARLETIRQQRDGQK
jgi:hypothetical protein